MLPRCPLSIVPLSLLVLIADWPAQTKSNDSPALWSRKLAPLMESRPFAAPLSGKGSTTQKQVPNQQPVAARKMSDDAGEMFFLEYWQFNDEPSILELSATRHSGRPLLRDNGPSQEEEDVRGLRNASLPYPLQPPFSLHAEQDHPILRRLPRALSLLGDRAFQCPTGTSSCTSISRPNSCCPSGEICQLIEDSGEGDVGCCRQGQSCSDEVAGCQQGYTSCPGSAGGGCCIPGYSCVGVGCVLSSTATVTVNPTVTASPTTSTRTSTTTPSPTTSISTTSTSVITRSSTVSTPSPSTTSTIEAASSSTLPISTSLTSTSGQAELPVRPTSLDSATTTTTTSLGSLIASICPTGFYQCSAYYRGGCCRVGRDCALSDCPTSTSTTIADTLGVTIVAPTGNGVGAATAGLGTGSCATGWSSCEPSLGGGCCPGGYGCGPGTTCTATAAGAAPSIEAKVAASGAQCLARGESWIALVAVFVLGFLC